MKDIKLIEKRYTKTGKRWKEIEEREEMVDTRFYENTTSPETIRFFRNIGGYEKVTRSYTSRGYIPTKITSISPDQETKITRNFIF